MSETCSPEFHVYLVPTNKSPFRPVQTTSCDRVAVSFLNVEFLMNFMCDANE